MTIALSFQYQAKTEAPPSVVIKTISQFESAWHQPWSEPVRFTSFKVFLQQSLAYYPRLLPTPNITGTMSAFEIGKDAAEFGVQVYTPEPTPPSLQGANVSIYEVPAIAGGNVSIKD